MSLCKAFGLAIFWDRAMPTALTTSGRRWGQTLVSLAMDTHSQ